MINGITEKNLEIFTNYKFKHMVLSLTIKTPEFDSCIKKIWVCSLHIKVVCIKNYVSVLGITQKLMSSPKAFDKSIKTFLIYLFSK